MFQLQLEFENKEKGFKKKTSVLRKSIIEIKGKTK